LSSPLNKSAAEYFSALTYRPDAKRRVCILPLGSIYWEDEIPDFPSLVKLGNEGQNQVLRIFAIRLRVWDDETLTEEDQRLWDATRQQLPHCPLFQRIELSEDDRRAREEVERSCREEFEAFFADADRVTVRELPGGIQEFSATFDLTKYQSSEEKKKPWWKRLFNRR
jgi:hypothetical protein